MAFAMYLLIFAYVCIIPSSEATNMTPTPTTYNVSDSKGPSRIFDGIGALSAGATSVLLRAYPEPQRSAVLDYLFLPQFGANLQILKVEIGGDAQSTDGSESSHMRTPWEENYERGYEWWLMAEAKKRNPSVLLYALPWAFPQWLTNGTGNIYADPQATATYVTKWVSGARVTYGLGIDYVGCWNERPYNTTYLKILRATLDAAGFSNTKIVAPDGDFKQLASDILKDPELGASVWGLGAHYPGTVSPPEAEETGKPLWSSEEDSTYNSNVAAGCWARVINQNYVNGNMTSSINWNLVVSYMKGTNWYRSGLMNAMQPWSGAYGTLNSDGSWTAGGKVWVTAHTTQFTQPRTFSYVAGGSGHLQQGGSYVTLENFATGQWTLVIEKMSHDRSFCVRPPLPAYDTQSEVATFNLQGSLARAAKLFVWRTHFAYDSADVTTEFERVAIMEVAPNSPVFTLNITVNSIYTVTTCESCGSKGLPPAPPVPPPTLFPAVHRDTFDDSCPISQAPAYFSQQNGAFECYLSGDPQHGTVLRAMVPERPVTWGDDVRPHLLVGHRDTKNMTLTVDVFLEKDGDTAVLGVRAQGTDNTQGILFGVNSDGHFGVWRQLSEVGDYKTSMIECGPFVPLAPGQWHTFTMAISGNLLTIWFDKNPIHNKTLNASWPQLSGHALLGTYDYGQYTQFDNFVLESSFKECRASSQPVLPGTAVVSVECNSEVGVVLTSRWDFAGKPNQNSTGHVIMLSADKTLCVAADAEHNWTLYLALCDPTSPYQLWSWNPFTGVSGDGETRSLLCLLQGSRCITTNGVDIGDPLQALPPGTSPNPNIDSQAFWFDFGPGEIGNEYTATCLGVC